MIKSFTLIKRISDLTQKEFLQYWREEHGPLVAKIVPGFRKYVQCHPVEMNVPGIQSGLDGIVQMWWENLESLQGYLNWRQSDEAKTLKHDEEKFIDTSQLTRFYGKEHVSAEANIQADNGIKSFTMIKRRSDLTQDEFLKYWREEHGPLVIKMVPGFRKYAQCYPVKVSGPGVQSGLDGIAQMWWDTLELFQDYLSWRQSEKGIVLKQDEVKFIDTNQLTRFWGKEHLIVER